MVEVKLLAVTQDGKVEGLDAVQTEQVPDLVQALNAQLVDFYAQAGFQMPWVAYVTAHQGQVVGGGAFKAPPANNQVEIVYYTLAAFENQGFATATAQALIDLAIQNDEDLRIVAQTLPENNASNHLLQKLGFTFFAVVDHPEDGPVWEWHLF